VISATVVVTTSGSVTKPAHVSRFAVDEQERHADDLARLDAPVRLGGVLERVGLPDYGRDPAGGRQREHVAQPPVALLG
jgi:hypothetical protein